MEYKNVIYSKTIVPMGEAPDGETPERIILCEERNGYAIYHESFDVGPHSIFWTNQRDIAIETAVHRAEKMIAKRTIEREELTDSTQGGDSNG